MTDVKQYAPKYAPWLSFGNILTILFGIIAAAGMFFTMDNRSASNAEDIKELQTEISQLESENKTLQANINVLKQDQARNDERFNSILSFMARIDSRLERIEGTR